MIKLTKGRYLFEYESMCRKKLIELEVLEQTEKNIKIQYLSGSLDWLTKKEFFEKYKLIEKLKSDNKIAVEEEG